MEVNVRLFHCLVLEKNGKKRKIDLGKVRKVIQRQAGAISNSQRRLQEVRNTDRRLYTPYRHEPTQFGEVQLLLRKRKWDTHYPKNLSERIFHNTDNFITL